ncbi:hypothetical protein DSO57_1013206 [Entomophthora muscae]|uniref:Uncharacterized protein n=1 Tax=Entomophthora muscae TaxID=34485 RepID=A0ACC2S7K3_9FUNG|nr:hypothetical protein DSO57_1013206 [Entomophthora muscae]
MQFTSILILATAIVSSTPVFSNKAPQDTKNVAKETHSLKGEQIEGLLCGENEQCLRIFGLGKALSSGRFGPKVLGKKAINKASVGVNDLRTMISTKNWRMDV